jgi:hypothetical protein
MNHKAVLLVAPVLVALTSMRLCADDGAASIAAGGIVVMGKEPRITMAKEVLSISISKVLVDYDFRNDTDENVTTEVAFPIPPYDLAMEEIAPAQQSFEGFRLWVDGAPAKSMVQVRAYLKGKDVTSLLAGLRIDIASFGHATSNAQSPDVLRLSASRRKSLVQAGVIDADDNSPNWEVRKKYYWLQTFPAHKTIHIRHEYSPVLGSTNSIKYGLGDSATPGEAKELVKFCIDGRLAATLRQIADSKDKDAPYSYVDFILTSANTWKTPIEDFTLIVERPHDKRDLANYVSFCWDGPITKMDADHFAAKARNLIPNKELRIGFFDVEKSRF